MSGFRIDRAAYAAARRPPQAYTMPQMAMLGIAASRYDAYYISALMKTQRPDGAWNCAPCLKVTSPRCDRAAFENPGRIYSDRTRIFSTAYAVAALSRVTSLSENVGEVSYCETGGQTLTIDSRLRTVDQV